MDAYWLPSSTAVIDASSQVPIIQNVSKTKDSNVGQVVNSTMASFANIFAGASAAVASSANVDSDLLQNGKNFMITGTVPPINQIEIPSGNQLSKRSGVLPIACTLPGMATISNIGLANGNMIISGTPAQISGDLQQITSGQISFASAPQMTVTLSKDFIQQAAAESGVGVGIEDNVTQTQIFTEQTNIIPSSISVAVPSDKTLTFTQNELEKPIKCPECDETFKQASALTYHTFVAHAQLQSRPHKCASCPESFLEAHHLEDHIKAIHSPIDSTYTCSECHTSFNNGGCLNYHIYMAHTLQGPKTLKYLCTQCGKSFIKAAFLAAHIKNVHGENSTLSVSENLSNTVQNIVANATTTAMAVSIDSALKQYVCSICNKGFKLPMHLKQHVLASHEKPHKCEVCGKGFGRRSDMNRHVRGVHMRERPHSCGKCGWTFSEAGNLKHHMLAVHSKEKNFRCSICSRHFSIPSYLKTHMARVHGILETMKTTNEVTSTSNTQQQVILTPAKTNNNNNMTHIQVVEPHAQVSRCFECGQVFANATMLQNHVMSTHPQPFWCTVCGEGFSQAFQLQNHLQVRHCDSNNNNINVIESSPTIQASRTNLITVNSISQSSGIVSPLTTPQLTKCSNCGLLVSKDHVCPALNKQVALTAAAAMAIAGERPHICLKCGKGFKTATHLKQHVRCVHSKERPHKCPRCQKTFARTSDLNRHIKGVHEKLKSSGKALRLANSKCSECGASFSESSQLKRHILTVHLNQRPTFKCADCQEGFPDEISFKKHICHEQDRPHTCTICSKRFAEITQLRRHIRSAHNMLSSQQRHKCGQCKRAFTRPVDLERHVHAVHLKEKPYKCGYCNKFFGLHGNLNKHIRAVHMLEKPHQCVECGKCFAHIGVLKRHLRDIHFYDRRPAHNNPRFRNIEHTDSSSAPAVTTQNQVAVAQPLSQTVENDPSDQNEDVTHLTMLQALEALQQEQLLQQQTSMSQQSIQIADANPSAHVQQSNTIVGETAPAPPSI